MNKKCNGKYIVTKTDQGTLSRDFLTHGKLFCFFHTGKTCSQRIQVTAQRGIEVGKPRKERARNRRRTGFCSEQAE